MIFYSILFYSICSIREYNKIQDSIISCNIIHYILLYYMVFYDIILYDIKVYYMLIMLYYSITKHGSTNLLSQSPALPELEDVLP